MDLHVTCRFVYARTNAEENARETEMTPFVFDARLTVFLAPGPNVDREGKREIRDNRDFIHVNYYTFIHVHCFSHNNATVMALPVEWWACIWPTRTRQHPDVFHRWPH